jgi:hypothetical protein
MEISALVFDIEYQLLGMTDSNGDTFGVVALDVGEIFIKTPSGEFFSLTVNKVAAADVDFIPEEDWAA